MFERIFPALLLILAIGVPATLAFWLYSIYDKCRKRAIESIYHDTESLFPADNTKKHTEIVYHTYSGVLAWVSQQEHRLSVYSEQGAYILKRLRNYNLKWGILAYGMVFIPFLAFGNYWAQMKKIRALDATEISS